MTWEVTTRDLPGWSERPWLSCFPETSKTWQPLEQYDYARERYHTETLAPGAWACGYWASAFDIAEIATGAQEGYDGTAAERDRIDTRFYRTIDEAINATSDPMERDYLEHVRAESSQDLDSPGYRTGRGIGETARSVVDTGKWLVPVLAVGGAAVGLWLLFGRRRGR